MRAGGLPAPPWSCRHALAGIRRGAAAVPVFVQINKEIGALRSAESIFALCERRMSEFDDVSIVTAIHRIAKSAGAAPCSFASDRRLLSVAASLSPLLSSCNAQSLANTAWSFATLRYRDAPLMSAISSAALRKIAAFSPQELANTPWAYAVLGCPDAPLMPSIASAARRQIA